MQQHQLEQNQSRRKWGQGKKTQLGKSSIKYLTLHSELQTASPQDTTERLSHFPILT